MYGCKVTIHSDHKPLEALCSKSLSKVPRRLQRLILRLQKYTIEVKWVPGKLIKLADALSRAPLPDKSPVLTEDDNDGVHLMINYLSQNYQLSQNRIEMIKSLNKFDPLFQQLHYYCQFGRHSSRKKVLSNFNVYWNIIN